MNLVDYVPENIIDQFFSDSGFVIETKPGESLQSFIIKVRTNSMNSSTDGTVCMLLGFVSKRRYQNFMLLNTKARIKNGYDSIDFELVSDAEKAITVLKRHLYMRDRKFDKGPSRFVLVSYEPEHDLPF